MYKKYTAVVLAVLLAAAEANVITYKDKPAFELLRDARNWEGFGLSADVNDYVDNTISMLVPFIQNHGLDPMPLPDVTEGFEVKPILITYSAWLKLHSGEMSGLVNVARSGDQKVYYFAKMMRVRVELQFKDLEFVYKYLLKVMNIGPTGGVVGSLNRFIVTVDLLFDFNNDEIHLQEFTLSDIGSIRVRLTGSLLNWLVTPVINVILIIFDNLIMSVVASSIRSGIQDGISFINSNVQDIVRGLEAMN